MYAHIECGVRCIARHSDAIEVRDTWGQPGGARVGAGQGSRVGRSRGSRVEEQGVQGGGSRVGEAGLETAGWIHGGNRRGGILTARLFWWNQSGH